MNTQNKFTENSYIFTTITTNKQRHILIDDMALLQSSIKKAHYNFGFDIIAICVLPDHIHMIIKVYNANDYSNILRQIKTHFSKNFDINKILGEENSNGEMDKQDLEIWQKKHWEHKILSQENLYRHIDYIHFNSVKHGYVETPKDWEYSTFKNFVDKKYYDIEWCNTEDKHKINCLEWE